MAKEIKTEMVREEKQAIEKVIVVLANEIEFEVLRSFSFSCNCWIGVAKVKTGYKFPISSLYSGGVQRSIRMAGGIHISQRRGSRNEDLKPEVSGKIAFEEEYYA